MAWAKRLYGTARRAAAKARLAVLLLVAFGLVVYGMHLWSVPAGYVAAGVLLAVWSVLFLLEVDEDGEDEP